MKPADSARRRIPPALVAPAAFALITLAMFGDLLLAPRGRVLSHPSNDLSLQFIPWRQFGFSELRHGNLALWNPHIFSGAPYFAGFQSALLYPPNWLHLIFPLGPAINWIVALHVFFAGYFTSLWVHHRGVSIAGSILAGAMFMFCGPYFLHIYAGHLPHLAVMVWTPLILLAIDGVAMTGSWRWSLLGAAAVALQILAGHPQYVYYTAIAATIYVVLLMIASRRRAAMGFGFVAIYICGAMLSAAQLLPGIDAQRESVRSAGTGYEFASTFSLPPANFVTLVAPHFFGRLPPGQTQPPDAYWGAGYLWEMSLFASITGLVLALYGSIARRGMHKWIILSMIAATLVLALGRHTPLYRPMLAMVPKYDSFRGTVKFAHVAILFTSLLAGIGFDELVRRARVALAWPIAVAALALALALAGWSVRGSPESWRQFVRSTRQSADDAGELFTRRGDGLDTHEMVAAAAVATARSLYIAAATTALIAAIMLGSRWAPRAIFLLGVLALIELFVAARATRATMQLTSGFRPMSIPNWREIESAWLGAVSRLSPEDRALNAVSTDANASMSVGYNDLWGYDPGVQRRYAELLAVSQGQPAKNASQYLSLKQVVPSIFRMLRCRLIFVPDVKQPIYQVQDPLPTVTVVSDWVLLNSAESSIAYMMQPGFDARQTVVLEAPPAVKTSPAADPPGSASVLGSGTDWLEIRAELSRPGILLITNSYSAGWRATPMGPSAQSSYRIVPANWALQGIALEAGTHHLRLEYLPAAFRIGTWISITSLLAFAAIAGGVLLMNRRQVFR